MMKDHFNLSNFKASEDENGQNWIQKTRRYWYLLKNTDTDIPKKKLFINTDIYPLSILAKKKE